MSAGAVELAKQVNKGKKGEYRIVCAFVLIEISVHSGRILEKTLAMCFNIGLQLAAYVPRVQMRTSRHLRKGR
jgi:hypothetical protein